MLGLFRPEQRTTIGNIDLSPCAREQAVVTNTVDSFR
jgi:hypothetical protein